jgi:hypothetical protein
LRNLQQLFEDEEHSKEQMRVRYLSASEDEVSLKSEQIAKYITDRLGDKKV